MLCAVSCQNFHTKVTTHVLLPCYLEKRTQCTFVGPNGGLTQEPSKIGQFGQLSVFLYTATMLAYGVVTADGRSHSCMVALYRIKRAYFKSGIF